MPSPEPATRIHSLLKLAFVPLSMLQYPQLSVYKPVAHHPTPPSPILRPSHPFDDEKSLHHFSALPSPTILSSLDDDSVWSSHIPSDYPSEGAPFASLYCMSGSDGEVQLTDFLSAGDYANQWGMSSPSSSHYSISGAYDTLESPTPYNEGLTLEFLYPAAEGSMHTVPFPATISPHMVDPSPMASSSSILNAPASNGESSSSTYVPSFPSPIPPTSTRKGKRRSRARKSTSPTNRSSRSVIPKASHIKRVPLFSQDDMPVITSSRLPTYPGLPTYEPANADGNFICTGCIPPKISVFTREPDYKRHMDCHYPESRPRFICCGIPLDMINDPRYQGMIREDHVVRTFYGQRMVGGCGQSLCRKDILRRHMMNSRHCVGDMEGYWYPKQEEERKRW